MQGPRELHPASGAQPRPGLDIDWHSRDVRADTHPGLSLWPLYLFKQNGRRQERSSIAASSGHGPLGDSSGGEHMQEQGSGLRLGTPKAGGTSILRFPTSECANLANVRVHPTLLPRVVPLDVQTTPTLRVHRASIVTATGTAPAGGVPYSTCASCAGTCFRAVGGWPRPAQAIQPLAHTSLPLSHRGRWGGQLRCGACVCL